MAETSSPTVWRRWLALELRRLRSEAKLSQRDVGKACGWSGARLSYIETGVQDVREDDLDQLLPLYQVPEDDWASYYSAAERSRERGWWERYQRAMPDYLKLFVGLEQGADVIQTFQTVVLPGLLQTPEYADRVLRRDVWPRTDQEIKRLVDLRVTRQEILTRAEDPAQFTVVLDEATLHHVAGDASVMAEQMDHLIEIAQRPNVAMRVLPFARGAQSYAQTTFTIFDFDWESDALVVYVEHRDQARYLEGQQDTNGFVLAFHNLWQLAAEESESLTLMQTIAMEYKK